MPHHANLIFIIQMGPLSTPNEVIHAMKRINQPYYSKIVQTVTNSPIYVHNENNNNNNQSIVQTKTVLGLLRPFNPVPAISVGTSNWNRPFRWKLLYPVPLFCILLTRTITKREVVWFGAVQPKCTRPLATWNVRTFKPLNCSALVLPYMARQSARTPSPYSLCIDANFFSMRRGEGPSVHRLPP